MPENSVGIPMTRPEKVDVPPRCCAYALDDDTMMKNDTCTAAQPLSQQTNTLEHTCSSPLVSSTITSDASFGSLYSGSCSCCCTPAPTGLVRANGQRSCEPAGLPRANARSNAVVRTSAPDIVSSV